jgi:hypothetical protein
MGNEVWTRDIPLVEFVEFAKRDRNTRYEKILMNGIAPCDNRSVEPMAGELFKKHPEVDVLVSNYGRVLSLDKSEIFEQVPDADPARYDYLYVRVPGKRLHTELVYRLVAETWCLRPDRNLYTVVHHISNNGYDNREQNLMWVTKSQHAMIHPWLKREGE